MSRTFIQDVQYYTPGLTVCYLIIKFSLFLLFQLDLLFIIKRLDCFTVKLVITDAIIQLLLILLQQIENTYNKYIQGLLSSRLPLLQARLLPSFL